ncbi:HAD family hydrolase [Neiella marina]|uniref:HAD family hydrolase n=1 Tax=Neiella holothuriorum TaxID=2870530 RepID=A0ABS7EKK3_9GAMM|nr:HAD family hydrolase [Neiella holothuriorum]MBW8192835.1 HAD family hydrolase [Neiella holothuriorum]
MKPVLLFDWGDTLMVDLPGMSGKMCDWPRIEVIEGAAQTLAELASSYDIYIASGAEQSSAEDIRLVFERANLAQYIQGYFCSAALGLKKGTPAFLLRLLMSINRPPMAVTMVGDSLERDMLPALALGMKAIWFRRNSTQTPPAPIQTIDALPQLLALA